MLFLYLPFSITNFSSPALQEQYYSLVFQHICEDRRKWLLLTTMEKGLDSGQKAATPLDPEPAPFSVPEFFYPSQSQQSSVWKCQRNKADHGIWTTWRDFCKDERPRARVETQSWGHKAPVVQARRDDLRSPWQSNERHKQRAQGLLCLSAWFGPIERPWLLVPDTKSDLSAKHASMNILKLPMTPSQVTILEWSI